MDQQGQARGVRVRRFVDERTCGMTDASSTSMCRWKKCSRSVSGRARVLLLLLRKSTGAVRDDLRGRASSRLLDVKSSCSLRRQKRDLRIELSTETETCGASPSRQGSTLQGPPAYLSAVGGSSPRISKF